MSSPPAPPDAGDPTSQPVFTDEILGEIFLRLDSAADLTRASATCTAFLRVVRFLRRNRSLYRQPVVGFLDCSVDPNPLHSLSLYHAEPPHPAAAAARALAEAADFTCSFLPDPDPGSWLLHDAAGGLFLLSSRSPNNLTDFEDIVVCDPFHRRYVRIPPIPADLTAGTSGAYGLRFLAPTDEEGSSLRVIWMTAEKTVTAFIFSSAIGQWRRVTFNGWNGYYCSFMFTSCRYHPHRSLYKSSELFSEVLMFNTHRMVFSVVRTPRVRQRHWRKNAIVETGEGRLGFLNIGDDNMLDLYCKDCRDSAEEWQHEKSIPIPLPDSARYYISFCGTGDGYLLIQAIRPHTAKVKQMPEVHCFTLHVKTLLVERLCMFNERIDVVHLYTNFLPPLSLQSI